MNRPLIIATNADMDFLDMIRDVLTEEGYDVLIIPERNQVFHVIKVHQPALVIVELLITDPEQGLMIVNKMRLDPSTTTIPVIIASTTTQLIRENEAHLRSKRCDILTKPFDLEELLAMVERHAPR